MAWAQKIPPEWHVQIRRLSSAGFDYDEIARAMSAMLQTEVSRHRIRQIVKDYRPMRNEDGTYTMKKWQG